MKVLTILKKLNLNTQSTKRKFKNTLKILQNQEFKNKFNRIDKKTKNYKEELQYLNNILDIEYIDFYSVKYKNNSNNKKIVNILISILFIRREKL